MNSFAGFALLTASPSPQPQRNNGGKEGRREIGVTQFRNRLSVRPFVRVRPRLSPRLVSASSVAASPPPLPFRRSERTIEKQSEDETTSWECCKQTLQNRNQMEINRFGLDSAATIQPNRENLPRPRRFSISMTNVHMLI